MKIEKVDDGIFVIDDFLTKEEEESINLNLKGAVWRYNWRRVWLLFKWK